MERNIMKKNITFVLGIYLLLVGIVHAVDPVTIESLLTEMTDRSEIARFPDSGFRTVEFTSYDRDSTDPALSSWFDNTDRYEWIRIEDNGNGDEYVIMDHQSPGVIVRSWMPDQDISSTVRFYLDGSDIPALEGDMITLFNGNGLIPPPFAHPSLKSAVSFFPIPYAQSCKVTVSEKPFYYIFTCREYPAGTVVESFTMEDFTAAATLTTQTGQKLLDPSSNVPSGTETNWQGTIAANAEAVLPLPAGAKAVNEFTINIGTTLTDRLTRSIIVKATFDGHDTIWCPLGDFFGTGVGLHPVEGWYRTVKADGTLSCRWVMPYQTSGSISLLNLHSESVDASMSVSTQSWTWDSRSMYFYSGWRFENPIPTRPYSDWNYVTLTGGRGVYVGDSLTVWNPKTGWWGEGDHKIWVDGESFPSMFGTGTEDYYAYSWGGVNNDFYEHPFHAQVRSYLWDQLNPKPATATAKNTSGYNTEIRSRALDTIPFNSRLQLDMEIWHSADCDMEYAVATHWYADTATTSNLSPAPDDALNSIRDEGDPVLSLSAVSLDFSNVKIGSSRDLTIAVENAGGGTLTGTATVSSPFTIVSGANYTLAIGASQDVVVRFSPVFSGPSSDSVTFTGADGATASVTGIGYVSTLTDIADVAADYVVGALGQTSADVGIVDSAGDGSWNYYQSNAIIMSNATASALLVVKNTLGTEHPTGYGGNGSYGLPGIADAKLFADGVEPAANELSFHPQITASNGQHVLFRWTAGASSAGNIRISGTVSNPVVGNITNPDINSISFHVVVNDVIVYEVFGNGHTLDETAFDINAFVNAGDTVDFVGTCQGHLSADESLLSAKIELDAGYIPPVIATYDNVITTLAIGAGNLSATVTGNSDPLNAPVFTLLSDDFEFPAGSDAAVASTMSNIQNPTATLTTSMAGTYKVKLEVSDGTTTVEAIAEVVVYADACDARKAAPSGWTAGTYDFDGNCLVDITDFAMLAAAWLDDTSMDAQEEYR